MTLPTKSPKGFPLDLFGEVYIDTHGPEHGLYVAFNGTDVRVRDFSAFCEANAETGRWEGVVRETDIDIATLMDPNGKHQDAYSGSPARDGASGAEKMANAIINAAISWLSYWGASDGETVIELDGDDAESACQYFGEFWGLPDGADRSHLACEDCAKHRAENLRRDVCFYAYGTIRPGRVWADGLSPNGI